MNKPCVAVALVVVGLCGTERNFAQDYALVATPQTVRLGGTVSLKLDGVKPIPSFTLSADTATNVTCSGASCTAPTKFPVAGIDSMDVEITASYTDAGGKSKTATTDITVSSEEQVPSGPWEGRVVVGYHQAGGSSADHTQNVIIDTFVMRPLARGSRVWESHWNSWGNVRIASAPRQLNTPFVDLVSSLFTGGANSPLNTNVNEMAESAEFETGIDYNFTPRWQGRMLSAIAFVGATGSFEAPDKSVRVFAVPASNSPQYSLFQQYFPMVKSTYIGFVNPDRERFYRQWGVGFRYSRFTPSVQSASPLTYSFTIGQDEAVTFGHLYTFVARVDAFYPLPIRNVNSRWRSLYLFGTTSLRLSRGQNIVPLVLAPAPSSVNPYDSTVSIVMTPSSRDTYRVGFGVDLVSLLHAHNILPNR